MDDTLNWLLLDCTVVAVHDTEDVADEVAITTLSASRKASWKLYRHFFFAAFFLSLLSSLLDGGGRASARVSESAGPDTSPPSENRRIEVRKEMTLGCTVRGMLWTTLDTAGCWRGAPLGWLLEGVSLELAAQ